MARNVNVSNLSCRVSLDGGCGLRCESFFGKKQTPDVIWWPKRTNQRTLLAAADKRRSVATVNSFCCNDLPVNGVCFKRSIDTTECGMIVHSAAGQPRRQRTNGGKKVAVWTEIDICCRYQSKMTYFSIAWALLCRCSEVSFSVIPGALFCRGDHGSPEPTDGQWSVAGSQAK